MAAALLLALAFTFLSGQGACAAAGFLKAPMSQEQWAGGSVVLHCEAVGSPMPEIQWWFEGNEPNDSCSQLWDGARLDRVHIHATYRQHAASTLSVDGLAAEDTGTYECRASSDPDRNHLTRPPRVKWVRAQASVVVLEPGTIVTSVQEVDSKTQLTCFLNSSGIDIVGHRWMRGGKVLQEDTLPDLQMKYTVDADDRSGEYSCIFLPEPVGRGNINVEGPPRIKVGKKSEHASEGEFVKLICKSEASHPPVDEWVWFKTSDTGDQTISNGTEANSKYVIISTPELSELIISDLDMNVDPGTYVCNATNSQGSARETISLRVRSRLAALWPFLGIVAEVLVLVTIIFIYEKRRKPDQTLDEDDPGAAPLKGSGSHLNDKDKNVRQRNAT
ncbi:basigin, isoform CRA_a [Rattus norvegicus]|uniref:Basigin n=3 Tax=Rattus norvegicus TaxID=10116 RepID=BASI_RAT|nr:basigin isoform 1 precursor [Rattus norvegicus]P26453.2 RecName: Full=Basigin; AltName: Full=Glycoprotein CE9; AltName: Full=OX-47 antigen; AltName: CD_antigen=CD147; Flags: Precursor [Rattus norvegicus]AAM81604.1 basigin 2 [Rattus norvegicus]EDL89403.1 basigin, isoform CRA_a [Rattus norvegicus]|eukprot:NP_001103352.1 basigin isoform 1 precursor [Rattus norvegicus]